MPACFHKNLVLLVESKKALVRCRHCHLTISKDELGGGYCPECLERQGKRLADFDEVEHEPQPGTRYRCEDCGAVIECE
ncbi:MAG: hypothetical protein ACLFTB_07935 [Desulfovibrionales bacterium]